MSGERERRRGKIGRPVGHMGHMGAGAVLVAGALMLFELSSPGGPLPLSDAQTVARRRSVPTTAPTPPAPPVTAPLPPEEAPPEEAPPEIVPEQIPEAPEPPPTLEPEGEEGVRAPQGDAAPGAPLPEPAQAPAPAPPRRLPVTGPADHRGILSLAGLAFVLGGFGVGAGRPGQRRRPQH